MSPYERDNCLGCGHSKGVKFALCIQRHNENGQDEGLPAAKSGGRTGRLSMVYTGDASMPDVMLIPEDSSGGPRAHGE